MYEKFAKFTPIANIHYPENKTTNYDKDQYEIFLQLKKALDATGNSYESLKLQAVSQAALRNINAISSGDKFILSTSDLSHEHGQSIGGPFLWILASVLLLTCFSFIDLTHRSVF